MAGIIDTILKHVLDSMTLVDGRGIRWNGSQAVEYKRYLSLLISDLMLDKAFQSRLNALRYYFTSENDVFFGHDLNGIFKEMKQEKKETFDEFKQKLDSSLSVIKSTLNPTKFELYYPLNVKTVKNIDIIKFRDVQIEVKDYDEIKSVLDDPTFNEKFKSEKFTKNKYKYIKVTIWARNQNYAQETATKYVLLLLGFITYSQMYRSSAITMMGIPEELTNIKLNYIFAFNEGKYSGYYFFEYKSDQREIRELTDVDISNLNKFVGQFNSAKGNIQEILFKAISLYYSGLTEKRINYSFLNFWTALEITTLKKKGVPHTEMMKRLKSVISNLNQMDVHKIDHLYSLRNNLVHDGAYDISQYDRDLMKSYTELMLEFFMFRLITHSIGEIQAIFQFLQKDNRALEENKKLIDFVINLRGSI